MNLYQKPSGIWVIDFVNDEGKRVRLSTGTRDAAAAKRAARELVSKPVHETRAGGHKTEPSRTITSGTMKDLWRRCCVEVWPANKVRSQATLRSNLRVLGSLLIDTPRGKLPVQDAAVEEVSNLRTVADIQGQLFAAGYAPGTVKRKMDTLSRSLRAAQDWGIIRDVPKKPPVGPSGVRERILEDHEEAVLFDVLAEKIKTQPAADWWRYRALIRFLLDTGCRLGEALAVRRSWIEAKRKPDGSNYRVLTIPASHTKANRSRTLPLTDDVVASINTLTELSPDDRLFPFNNGFAWYRWDTLREAMQKRGCPIDDVVLHSLRHTCLTRLAKRLPIQIVSKWAGHADISITARVYSHLSVDDLLGGLDVLNNSNADIGDSTMTGLSATG
jgi:integrase